MSHITFNNKWQVAMEDLKELLQMEEDCACIPTTTAEMLLYAPKLLKLYVRYTMLANELEDCQYNVTQPQKRDYVGRLLNKVLIRVLQLKRRVIELNPHREGSPHLYLADVLTYLDVAPEQALLRLPRCFREDPAVVDDWDTKQQKLQYWTEMFRGGQSVAPDILKAPAAAVCPTMTFDEAAEIITRYERGRASIRRLCLLAAVRKKMAARMSFTLEKSELVQQEAATKIQAAWRGHLCRKRVITDKQQQLLFYEADYVSESSDEDKLELERCFKTRKVFQKEAEKEYKSGLEADRNWLRENVASEIIRRGVEEGKDWMLEFRRRVGSLPESLADQEKDYQGIPPPPSDGKQYNISAILAGKSSSSKSKPAAAPSKDLKGGSSKRSDKEGLGEPDSVSGEEAAPSKTVVDELQELTGEFDRLWSSYKCDLQQEACYDTSLARRQLQSAVESEALQQTQQVLQQELSLLRAKLEGVKENDAKKKKKKNAARTAKKGKSKKKCCSNLVLSHLEPLEDIYPDLVKDGIIKLIQPATLDCFLGSVPTVPPPTGSEATEMLPAPTAWHVKQYLVEQILLPLASSYIRQNTPFPARSLLLFGPAGSGKSLLARIIASECRATFFDLSPAVIENIYKQPKIGPALLLHKTFLMAQQEAPAVIYIDNVHEVFTKKESKKKKRGGDSAGGSGQAQSTAWRIKDPLRAHLELVKKPGELSEASDRVLIIGCTSAPFAERVDTKAMTDFFEHKLYISVPDSSARSVLWQAFLRKKKAAFRTLDAAKVSILAEMADGYSAGSLEMCVEEVANESRMKTVATEPLEVDELGRFLYTRQPYCSPEEREKFASFDFLASGEMERAALRKAAAESEKKSRK